MRHESETVSDSTGSGVGRSRSLKTAPFDRPLYDFLLVAHCKYVLFSSYLELNNIVTLKYGLEVTQDH